MGHVLQTTTEPTTLCCEETGIPTDIVYVSIYIAFQVLDFPGERRVSDASTCFLVEMRVDGNGAGVWYLHLEEVIQARYVDVYGLSEITEGRRASLNHEWATDRRVRPNASFCVGIEQLCEFLEEEAGRIPGYEKSHQR